MNNEVLHDLSTVVPLTFTNPEFDRACAEFHQHQIFGTFAPRLIGINLYTQAEVVQVAAQKFRHAGRIYITLHSAFESR